MDDISRARAEIKQHAVDEAVKRAVEVTDLPKSSNVHHNRIIVGLFIIILAMVGFGIWNHVVNYKAPPVTCPTGSTWVLVHPSKHITWSVCQVTVVPSPTTTTAPKRSQKHHRPGITGG